MRDITTDPDEWVIRLGLIVITHEGGEKGRRYPGGIITLRSDLGPTTRRCTLMHEIAHHIHRDEPTTDPWLHSRQERRAHEWAADHLITPENYKQAENLVGSHDGALARELNVTTKYIRLWRDLHERKLTS